MEDPKLSNPDNQFKVSAMLVQNAMTRYLHTRQYSANAWCRTGVFPLPHRPGKYFIAYPVDFIAKDQAIGLVLQRQQTGSTEYFR